MADPMPLLYDVWLVVLMELLYDLRDGVESFLQVHSDDSIFLDKLPEGLDFLDICRWLLLSRLQI